MSTVTINWLGDEAVSIEVDGTQVASACHDEQGWSGMEAVIKTATEMAKALGVEVRTEWTPNL